MDVFSLRARAVFPVVAPPLLDGVVSVRGDRIESIGKHGERVIRDLGDIALLPGLVNAHTHLEFSELRSPLGS